MKFFLLSLLTSLLFCPQDTSASTSIQEYKLDNTRVIICDDFFLPVAKVGVIYPVGLNQLKNICEAEMIEKTFLSKTTKRSAKTLGTDINFSIHDNFSEASAIVSNKQISDIVKIILDNKPDTKNPQLIKNQVKIEHKLSDYFETNIIGNEIYAGIDPRYVFNESILDDIKENDLKNSLDKYNKARLDIIIICGKSDTKQLIKKLCLKQSNFAETNKAASVTYDFPKRIVESRSKFFGRSLRYIYQIAPPELAEKRNAIFSILSHEIFNYPKKYSQLVDDFFITDLMKPNLFMLGFRLKGDISKKSFEFGFRNLLYRLKKTKFSQDKSELISKLEKFSEIDVNENLNAKYRMIRNQYILYSQTKKNVSDEILEISQNDVKNFVEQVLENGLVAKISTQYRAEN